MYPVLFRLGDFEISTYGAAVALGVLLAGVWMDRVYRERELGLSGWDTALSAVICGWLGARLLYIAIHGREFLDQPAEYIFSRSGFVFSGGLIGGMLAVHFMARRARAPFLDVADATAAPLALGHAVGRIGCFLFGCCYGKPVSPALAFLGARFPDDSQVCLMQDGPACLPVHPSQLYESALLFALAAALWRFLRSFAAPGRLAGLYLLVYGLGRIGIEWTRADDRGWLAPEISVTQFVSALAALAGLVLLARPVARAS